MNQTAHLKETRRSGAKPMTSKTKSLLITALAAAFVGPAPIGAQTPAAPGVYQYVVRQAEGTVDSVAAAIAAAAPGAGFQLLAMVPVGTPAGCSYKASVVALYAPDYGREIVTANRRTGPFAVVDRVNVFADEKGVHVSVVNPRSILRTTLMDDQKHTALIESHLGTLRKMVSEAVKGTASAQDYGQRREHGYIGKTMGVMAGGPFSEKVTDLTLVEGDWKSAASRVRSGLEKIGPAWGLRLAYALEIPEAETFILGTTGSPMDSKSFEIVGAGADETRDNLKCPGLAHAGAYPIEVVVAKDAKGAVVRLVASMYRMKMFFEDAGKWAFMKNMGMPGSIQDEIAAQVKAGIASR